jgi:hypothetical protein
LAEATLPDGIDLPGFFDTIFSDHVFIDQKRYFGAFDRVADANVDQNRVPSAISVSQARTRNSCMRPNVGPVRNTGEMLQSQACEAMRALYQNEFAQIRDDGRDTDRKLTQCLKGVGLAFAKGNIVFEDDTQEQTLWTPSLIVAKKGTPMTNTFPGSVHCLVDMLMHTAENVEASFK